MALGRGTRSMAFFIIFMFLCGTAIGSVLPEFGNLLATRLDIGAHSFNIIFLFMGIAGIGVALYLGYHAGG